MINYLSNKFALTENGARDLIKGIIYTTLLDISLVLPVGLYLLLIYQWIAPLIGGIPVEPNLGLFMVFIFLVLGIIFAFQWKQYHFVFNTTYTESEERRISLAENLRKLPMSFFGNRDLSDLTTTIMGDCTELEHTFSHAIPQLLGSLISIILLSIGMFIFDWRLSIALFWVVPVSLAIVFIARKFQQKGNLKVIKKGRESSDCIQECLESVKDLKSYNYENEYLNNLDDKIKDVESAKIRSELMSASGVITGTMVLKLGIVSVMLVGAALFLSNQINIFVFLMFLIAASSIYNPVENALMFLSEIFNSDLKIKRMNDIKSQVIEGGSTDYCVEDYNIKFENVNFSYDDSEDVLKNISFVAKQGEVTALIGPSGSGKSTVSKLAAKLWEPTKGKVKLGNVDLATVDNEKILENYSIVFQDVVLFNTSVMENIRIGKRDASDEEVLEAAKIAMCDEFINDLPEGYETVIGENGILLSGGQRQRISIARALLKDAPIIILDEATSFLDVENESKIQKALSALIQNKTVLVIAHRMRTIANTDKIVVLDKGSIVEEGDPNELLKNNGLFAKMIQIQNESSQWEI